MVFLRMLKNQRTDRLALFAFIFISLSPVFGQIVIDDGDMPSPNEIFFNANSQMNGNDVTETGENFVWNYSDLGELTTSSDTAVSLGGLQPLFQLVFNNSLIFPDYVSDHYFGGQGFDLGVLAVDNIINFYRKTSGTYEQSGFGGVLNGQEVPVTYDPKDIIYEFPMMYGGSTNNYAFFEATIPTLGYWSEDIYRNNEIEGWGTLILPNSIHEVLKVKTTLNVTDSIYVDFIMLGTMIEQPERIEYKWIAKDMGIPVLTITEIAGQVTSAEYYINEPVMSGILDIDGENFEIYPNPTYEFLTLKGNTPIKNYVIYNADGKVVLTKSGADLSSIDVSNIKSGNYILELNKFRSIRFVKY